MAIDMHIGWVDYSNERAGTKLYLEDVEAGGTNWDELAEQVTGKHDVVKTAMALITRLNHTKTIFSIPVEQSVESLPIDPMAQRELAIRWAYVDNVNGDKGSFHTYAPVDLIMQNGTDVIDVVNNVAASTFSGVIEANCVSRDGNPITVTGARLVGRNT